jgi:uncharacterized protein (DUF427 family)
VERERRRVRVIFNGETVADSTNALRVLETSSPPTIYVPRADIRMELLEPVEGTTFCEWKGRAHYFNLRVNDKVSLEAAWTYPSVNDEYAELADHVAFYASRVDEAYLDDERVTPQPGSFYGGWVTPEIVGPFKGEPGSRGW